MLSRTELIEILAPPLIQKGHSQRDARAVLDSYSSQELYNQYVAKLRSGEIRGRVGDGYGVPTPAPGPTAAELQAERDRKLEETRQLIEQDRKQAQDDRIRRETEFALEQEKFISEVIEPKKRAEAAAALQSDKQGFADAYSTRLFSNVIANFEVLRSVLGPGELSTTTILQAIRTHQVQLAPPTAEERQAWAEADVDQHNQKLVNSTSAELRNRIRQEAPARQAAAVQAETQAADTRRAELDRKLGYPPLPQTWLGQRLDSVFIKRASRETLKTLISKFGPNAVTDRLRGTDGAFKS